MTNEKKLKPSKKTKTKENKTNFKIKLKIKNKKTNLMYQVSIIYN